MKFFQVVSILQKTYNIPIATHSPKGGLNHLNILLSFGADPDHIYLSHLENSINEKNFNDSISDLIKIAQTGASILLSNFGFNENGKRCIVSANIAKYLKNNGYLNKILISADSYWRWKNNQIRTREYRENQKIEKNLLYTFQHTIPVLKKLQFSDEDIHEILYVNPYNMFNF
jgi:predicted metal-dependent phosphotriesterase family hydrolase